MDQRSSSASMTVGMATTTMFRRALGTVATRALPGVNEPGGGVTFGGGSQGGTAPSNGGASQDGGALPRGGQGGFVPPDDFDSLKLAVSGGYNAKLLDMECDWESEYTLDVATRTLAWSRCVRVSSLQTRVRRGSHTLTTEDLEEVRTAVAALGPAGDGCGFDRQTVTLDIHTQDELFQLVHDFNTCTPRLDGRTHVSNLDAVLHTLFGLAESAPPPAIEKITVVASKGNVPDAPEGGECLERAYPDTYVVEVGERSLTWDECAQNSERATEIRQGSRILSETELESVLTAARSFEPGGAGQCVADRPLTTTDVATSNETLRYVDDSGSCMPRADGGIFVTNPTAVAVVLRPLASEE